MAMVGLVALSSTVGTNSEGHGASKHGAMQSVAQQDQPVTLVNGQGWSATQVASIDAGTPVAEAFAEYPLTDGTTLQVGVVGDASGDLPVDVNDEVVGTMDDMGLIDGNGESGTSGSTSSAPSVRALSTDASVDGNRTKVARSSARRHKRDNVRVLPQALRRPPSFKHVVLRTPESKVPTRYRKFIENARPVTRFKLMSDADCSGSWSPTEVRESSGESSVVNHRYGSTKFYWGATRMGNLKCYDDVTFEPDFVTYNYDDKHYYDKGITAWASNMPDPYKDTQFSDSGDERVYTVGESHADRLVKDTWYRAYFRTEHGNTGSDTAKLNLQRGNRTPSICDSTWCIFAKATNRVPDSGWFDIPSDRGWYMP
ncbi:MAG TPA: hypothetical protein VI452_02740 [Marmoricola sp.]